jgi:hypothetical protein
MKNAIKKIVLDPFCYRQFDKTKSKVYIDFDRELFADKINEIYISSQSSDNSVLKDGYAPFCKHIFVKNFTSIPPGYVEINDTNINLIKSCYEARTEKELPVLRRYINLEDISNNTPSIYLDIILYSKEQIQKENQAMGNTDPNGEVDYDYGIISVKPQNEDYELPMDPITIMRNSLGIEEGGSGIKLDRNKYMQSVEFWTKHVLLK